MKLSREQSRLFFCAQPKIGDSGQCVRLGSFCSLTCFPDAPKVGICFWVPRRAGIDGRSLCRRDSVGGVGDPGVGHSARVSGQVSGQGSVDQIRRADDAPWTSSQAAGGAGDARGQADRASARMAGTARRPAGWTGPAVKGERS